MKPDIVRFFECTQESAAELDPDTSRPFGEGSETAPELYPGHRAVRTIKTVAAVVCVIVASGGSFPVLASGRGGNYALAHTFVQNFAVGAGFLLLFLELRSTEPLNILRRNWALVAVGFGAPCLATALSSSPWRGLATISGSLWWVAAMCAIASWRSIHDQLTVVVLGFAIPMAFAYSVRNSERMWIYGATALGPYSHENFLGHACAFLAVVATSLVLLRPRHIALCLVAVGLAVFWHRESRSDTTALAVVLTIAISLASWMFPLVRKLVRRRSTASGRTIGIRMSGLLFVIAAQIAFDKLGTRLGKNSTLSGRTTYWRALAPELWAGFWTGHGPGQEFFSTGRRVVVAARAGFDLPHSHNGFIDLLLDGGVVWLASLLALFGIAIKTVHQQAAKSPRVGAALSALVAIAAVLNLTEPDFVQSMRPTLLIVGIVAAHRTFGSRLAKGPVGDEAPAAVPADSDELVVE